MKIIKVTPSEIGSRPPVQDWAHKELPSGYAWCPDEFVELFYSTSPAGFVNITVENEVVTGMTLNEEARMAYIASLPEPTEEEPSAQEDTDAMLVDHEYRITMLELGV